MDDDLAKKRFVLLNIVRLSGAVLVVLGVATIGKRLVEPADAIGTALLLGAVAILLVPRLLATRWRSDER